MAEMSGIFRLPLIPIFFSYGIGICLGHFDLPLSLTILILASLVLLILWVFSLVMKRRMAGTVLAIAFFFLFGILSIRHYTHPPPSPSSVSRFIGFDGVSLEGTLYRPAEDSHGRTQLRIRAQKVIRSNQHFAVGGRLLVFLKGSH